MRPGRMFEAMLRSIPASILLFVSVFLVADYQPIWDGKIYWDCVRVAAETGAGPMSFNCANHPTMGYFWPIGLVLRLVGPTYGAVIGVNLILAVIAIIAFNVILLQVDFTSRAATVFASAVLASNPVFQASVVQLSPDFGVMVCCVVALAAMLTGHRHVLVLAGLCAVLSKETGLALYLSIVLSQVWLETIHTTRSRADKLDELRRLLPLLLPVVVFLFVFKSIVGKDVTFAAYGTEVSLARQILSFSLLDNIFASYLATIFIVNFTWIITAVIAVAAGPRFGRAVIQWALREPSSMSPVPRQHVLIGLVFLTVFFLLTRYRTFANPRYFLFLIPLMILIFMLALNEMKSPAWQRILVLGAVICTNVLSLHRTVDPVSIAAFGQFDVGNGPMLSATSITGECCGHGRDQLVYNLQFVTIQKAYDAAFQSVREAGFEIAMHHDVDWYFDSTAPQEPAPWLMAGIPRIWSVIKLRRHPPERWPVKFAYFLTPFTLDEVDTDLDRLADDYDIGPRHEATPNGTIIQWIELARKTHGPEE